MDIPSTITLYGIGNCDTVRAARAWLALEDVPYRFHDYKKAGVPRDRLTAWVAQLGRDALLNRQGTTWRKLDDMARQMAATDEDSVELMVLNPSLVRRPVVEWASDGDGPGEVSVGFDAERWRALARNRAA